MSEPGNSACVTPQRTTKQHFVLQFFTCKDLIKQHWSCNLCGWLSSHSSIKRKLQHILCVDIGAVRTCPKHTEVDMDAREKLLNDLQSLDSIAKARKEKRTKRKAATQSLALPTKKQKKISSFIGEDEKFKIDVSYARVIIMSAVKKTFLESPFTFSFFEVNTNHL